MGRPVRPLEERFWARVQKGGPDECWPWTGGKVQGYGSFCIGKGKYIRAHQFTYKLAYGEIPDGLVPDHTCRNRACQNPAHLEAVTNKVNILRGEGAPAVFARRTHCKNGHPLSGDNLAVSPTKYGGTIRRCRTCERAKYGWKGKVYKTKDSNT